MSDFIFLSPWWLIALIPLALLLWWLACRAQNQSLIAPHLATALGLGSDRKQRRALTIAALSWLIAVIALAGPSFEKQARPSYSSSNTRVVVMDMSRSMYATDIKPNRLAQARYKVLDLLKGWQEGNTALIAYSADAYTVSPLTSDSATIANLVPSLSPDIMPYSGANAASGVAEAISMLNNAGFSHGDIIVLADDLDRDESQAIETLLQDTGYRIMIVGLGTRDGAPITLPDGSLLKNDAGQTVVAKTDFTTMQALASDLGGIFTPYRADGGDVDRLLAATHSERPQTGKKNTQTVTDHINNGYWLVLVLLLPALLMFRRGFIFMLLMTTGVILPQQRAEASPWLNSDQQAMKAFQENDFHSAAEQFTTPEWKGIARYKAKNYSGAVEALSQIEDPSPATQYNLANAYAQAGELNKAKQMYQQVLQAQPENKDAKHNLQVVEQALKQQQQEQQQQQKSDSASHQSQQDQKNNSPQSQPGKSGESNNPPSQPKPEPQSSSEPNQQNASSGRDQTAQDAANSTSSASQSESDDSQHKQDKPKHASQAAPRQSQTSPAQTQPDDTAATTTGQATTKPIDPELRKLEQVENARDPSQLLRAQLYFQAQDREPPQTQGKKW